VWPLRNWAIKPLTLDWPQGTVSTFIRIIPQFAIWYPASGTIHLAGQTKQPEENTRRKLTFTQYFPLHSSVLGRYILVRSCFQKAVEVVTLQRWNTQAAYSRQQISKGLLMEAAQHWDGATGALVEKKSIHVSMFRLCRCAWDCADFKRIRRLFKISLTASETLI
jgi:hypothetical protein